MPKAPVFPYGSISICNKSWAGFSFPSHWRAFIRKSNKNESNSLSGTKLYAQFSGRKSLRNLVVSLNRQIYKLYHLGFTEVKRTTLADANEQRPAVIFEETYHQLVDRVYTEMARQQPVNPRSKSSTQPPSICVPRFSLGLIFEPGKAPSNFIL